MRADRPLLLAALLAATILAVGPAATGSARAASPAETLKAEQALFPPWHHGDDSDITEKGLDFTIPPVDDVVDFHGSLDQPGLVLYASGNYFFALGDLVKAFEAANPAYAGKVFYETLPPGILLKQLAAGGTVTIGALTFTVKPDILMFEQAASRNLVKDGKLADPVISFATNDLTIMVPAGNPGHITGLADLGYADVATVMPNPTFEGVARQIRASLVKAGGEELAKSVYETKVAAGTTILTQIHHRQTPLYLMQGRAVAGVTWTSEAMFQEKIGHPITHVAIPDAANVRATYSAAAVPNAPHGDAARAWLAFLQTDTAFKLLEPYGFKRVGP